MKQLIAFDLDGTLAKSKSALDDEMAKLLNALLKVAKVAVISGGNWPQFQKQVLSMLEHDKGLGNLFILPTCGTKFYRYDSDWRKVYSENLSVEERGKIIKALEGAVQESDFGIKETWGETIEDRGTQITYSALGQKAPLDEKEKWDPKFSKRKKMKARLDKLLPEFTVRLGGTTSVDITRHGIDKAYGIRKLRDILKIPIEDMIFLGDALFPGGNDHAARKTGVLCIEVRDPLETKRVIQGITACLTPGMPAKSPRKD